MKKVFVQRVFASRGKLLDGTLSNTIARLYSNCQSHYSITNFLYEKFPPIDRVIYPSVYLKETVESTMERQLNQLSCEFQINIYPTVESIMF